MMKGVENMKFKIKEEITVTMEKEDIEKMIIECLQSKGYEVIKVNFNIKKRRKIDRLSPIL